MARKARVTDDEKRWRRRQARWLRHAAEEAIEKGRRYLFRVIDMEYATKTGKPGWCDSVDHVIGVLYGERVALSEQVKALESRVGELELMIRGAGDGTDSHGQT